jgi:hypothetical protein
LKGGFPDFTSGIMPGVVLEVDVMAFPRSEEMP